MKENINNKLNTAFNKFVKSKVIESNLDEGIRETEQERDEYNIYSEGIPADPI